MSRWAARSAQQAALTRLARRKARRGGWRTLLVVTLLALGVATATAVAVGARSSVPNVEAELSRQFGAADLLVERATAGTTFDDLPPELQRFVRAQDGPIVRPGVDRPDVDRVLLDVLPASARVAMVVRRNVAVPDGPGVIEIVSIDLDDPITDGLLRASVAPGPGEALLSRSAQRRLGATTGDEVELPGTGTVAIVGTVEPFRDTRLPLAVLHPDVEVDAPVSSETWLVDLPDGGPVDVDALQARLSPAAEHEAGVHLDLREWSAARYEPSESDEEPTFMGIVVGSVLLVQVALLSAAAFATGLRRRLRDHGILGAVGASPAQIRQLVLREGLVLGVAGGVLAVVLGLAAVFLGQDLIEWATGKVVDGLRLHVLDLVAPAGLSVLAAIVAAYVPARTAGRVPVVTALAGRLPIRRVPGWFTPAAVGTSALGLLLLLGITRGRGRGLDEELMVAVGVVASIAGACMLAVPLVRSLGRGADRLPVWARLPVRDTVRQGTRSAVTVAALTVVVTAPIAGAVFAATEATRFGPPDSIRTDLVAVAGPWYDGWLLPPTDDMVAAAERRLPTVEDRTEVIRLGEPGRPIVPIEITLDGAVAITEPTLATPELLVTLGLTAFRSQVAAGTVLVLDRPGVGHVVGPTLPSAGRATLSRFEEPGGPADPSVEADMLTVSPDATTWVVGGLLVPPAVADQLGLAPAGGAVLLDLERDLTDEDHEALSTPEGTFTVHGSGGLRALEPTPPTTVMIAAALLVATLISWATSALAATESDHDLELMAAVGAPPRLRRVFHGVQAGYHTAVAAVLGLPLALLISFALHDPADIPLAVPWAWISVIVLGLPLAVGLTHLAGARSARVGAPRRVA